MPKIHNVIIDTEFGYKHFLKIKETSKGDIIVSPRGMRHSVPLHYRQLLATTEQHGTVTNITVHPNLKSEINSITINFKDNFRSKETRTVAGVLEVKKHDKMYPILASVGRNISTDRLNYDISKPPKGSTFDLWEGHGLSLKSDSLAYVLAVCNKDLDITFPEDFPRLYKFFEFKHLKLVLFYWVFNQPTKHRGTSLRLDTNGEYLKGLQVHDIFNLTNDLTMTHMNHYPSLPDI